MGRHTNTLTGVTFNVDDSKDDRYTEAGGFTAGGDDSGSDSSPPAKKTAAKKSDK